MSASTVQLAHVEAGDGGRSVRARRTGDGGLVEGQDLGPGVVACFGSDEYEWAFTVPVSEMAALLGGLGGDIDGDALDQVAETLAGEAAFGVQQLDVHCPVALQLRLERQYGGGRPCRR